jgi:hypothetical protein
MKEEELKKLITYTAFASVLIWIAINLYLKIDLRTFDSFQNLGTAVSIVSAFWLFYFRWGWKWIPLKYIFFKPDLNGTWIGCYETDGLNEKGQRVPIGEISLTIRQNFLFIHVTSYTEKHVAHSYAENLFLDTNRGVQKLVYLYSQNRVNPGAEGARQGATELSIFGVPPFELSGNFWTNAKSNGFLKIRRVSKKQISSFSEAKREWPRKQDWKTIKKSRIG